VQTSSDKKIEIRLARVTTTRDKPVEIAFLDELSPEEFRKLEDASNTIEELHSIRRLRDFVVLNDEDLLNMLQRSLDDLISKAGYWNGIKRNDNQIVFDNSNRLLLNYLSSIRTFIDHSNTVLKRKFGENSKTYLEYKNILSVFYDNSFAYRFFYKLRNYAQHVGLPLDSFHFSTQYNHEENSLRGEMIVVFDRDQLLLRYDSWGTVKQDLKKLDAEFDVIPLMFEMTHNIKEIERNIELFHKSELLEAIDYLTHIAGHLRDNESEIIVAFDFKLKENGELASYSTKPILFDIMDDIRKSLE